MQHNSLADTFSNVPHVKHKLVRRLERIGMNLFGHILIVTLAILFILALLVFGPLATIWSLNTLFGLEIAYSFRTWIAVAWLMVVIQGVRTVNQG